MKIYLLGILLIVLGCEGASFPNNEQLEPIRLSRRRLVAANNPKLEEKSAYGYLFTINDSIYYIYYFDDTENNSKNSRIDYVRECKVLDTTIIYDIIQNQGWQVLETSRFFEGVGSEKDFKSIKFLLKSKKHYFIGGMKFDRFIQANKIYFAWFFNEEGNDVFKPTK